MTLRSTSSNLSASQAVAVAPVALTAGLEAATANVTAAQAALTAGGRVNFTIPGIYFFNATLTIPSFTDVYIGEGVIFVRANGGAACTMFANANPTTGDEKISLTGKGILYFNANSYKNTYDANNMDCPYNATLYALNPAGILDGGGTITGGNPNSNGLQFDNVKRLAVGGGLLLMQANKYQLYGSKISQFLFDDIKIYSDDTINPANGSTQGRDGIHVQGNSQDGVIQRIAGTTNDDFIVLNPRDENGLVTPRSVGPIRNVVIEKIVAKVQRRGGAAVHVYGALDVGTVDAPATNGYDVAPLLTSITQVGGVATATVDAAHNMNVGSAFYITGSTVTGYRTGTAAYGQSLALGRVLAVPSPTTFTYTVPAGTATPATATLGTFVRYYEVSQITVRDVRGELYVDSVVSLGAYTTGSALNFGVLDGVVVDEVTGLRVTSNGAALVYGKSARMHDSTVGNIVSKEQYLNPAIDFSTNNFYVSGTTTVNGVKTTVPYKPYSSSGQAFVAFNYLDNVILNSLDATILDGGGGWNNAVGYTGIGTITINSPKLSTVSGSNAQIIQCQASGSAGEVVINTPVLRAACGLFTLGGGITSGSVTVNGLISTDASIALINYYGTGCSFYFGGNTMGTTSGGGIIYSSTSGSLSLYSSGNNWGSATLMNTGATGNISAFGFDLPMDLTKVVRTTGSYCKAKSNTGTGGTTDILANNLCVCDATNAAGSWHQLSDPIGRTY